MVKNYKMLQPEEEAAAEASGTLQEMIYFGKNAKNYRIPGIEVNEENQAKLQRLADEYKDLILQEKHKDLDLKTFFAEKGINLEFVEEFEEPRDVFILLNYFKEFCTLRDFEPVAVMEID